ncbi:MAG TPA: hypothetical protein VL198_03865 [Pseudolabrys sp.]|jgi:hypothetical protein|nr:hypothetical protein [Pseudolabrys sp.]
MIDWTADRIASLDTEGVMTLRQNADRLGVTPLVELCDADLARRSPAPKLARGPRHDQVVVGFHFVCPKKHKVTKNDDGTMTSGTWAVAAYHAERAKKIGAYIALHEKKSDPSYLQGKITHWEPASRLDGEEPKAIEIGVDFTFEPDDQPRNWVGDQAGEKGYSWKPKSAIQG